MSPPPRRSTLTSVDPLAREETTKAQHHLRERHKSLNIPPKSSYLFKFAKSFKQKSLLKEVDFVKTSKLYHDHLITRSQNEKPIVKRTLKSYAAISKKCNNQPLEDLRDKEARSAIGPFELTPIRTVNLNEIVRREEDRKRPIELLDSWYIGGRMSTETPLSMRECTVLNMGRMIRDDNSNVVFLFKYFERTEVSIQNVLEYE